MPEFLTSLFDGGVESRLLATLVVLLAAFAGRAVTRRAITRLHWASETQGRRVYVQLRTLILALAGAAVLVIWASELRSVALSLIAVAVALVVATKELISAAAASLVRASSGTFQIGDRIRIGELRGDVIDHSLLQTTLLEIGPTHVRTGRTLTVPNSLLLAEPIANETRGNAYILHSFVVPVTLDQWRAAEEVLLHTAREIAEPYLADAEAVMQERARRYAIPMPVIGPMILPKVASPDQVDLTVRIPVRPREVWSAEDNITRAWLDRAD
jgi:small-conductance mechanosensitive channel